MKKYVVLALLIIITISYSAAQRYQNQIFNEVDVKTETYLQTKDEALKLDIYQPC